MIGWLVKYVMNNFLHTFGGEDRKQEEGGPTGDHLMQAISRTIGQEYNELFLKKVEKMIIKVKLYDRHVDEQNIFGRSFGRSTKFAPWLE